MKYRLSETQKLSVLIAALLSTVYSLQIIFLILERKINNYIQKSFLSGTQLIHLIFMRLKLKTSRQLFFHKLSCIIHCVFAGFSHVTFHLEKISKNDILNAHRVLKGYTFCYHL